MEELDQLELAVDDLLHEVEGVEELDQPALATDVEGVGEDGGAAGRTKE
jgi:hypothetical protein